MRGGGELEANDITAGPRKRGERQATRSLGRCALGARAQLPWQGPRRPQRPCRGRLWKRPASSPNFFSGERVSSGALETHVPTTEEGQCLGWFGGKRKSLFVCFFFFLKDAQSFVE